MVDEFQDVSVARARLVDSLIENPGHFLFAVGDDWQGINRFAGADIAVMTGFTKKYKRAKKLQLSKTFRCPQSLCDVTGKFIMKNPVQIKKKVKSDNVRNTPSIACWSVDDAEAAELLLGEHLNSLASDVELGVVPTSKDGRVSIFIMGRYNDDKPSRLPEWENQFKEWLEIKWTTIHRAKGSESDYVFVVNMVRRIRGFPSQIEDDPVLRLAMPADDSFPHAEERRIFYVALTRARRQVRIYTSNQAVSEFLTELKEDGLIEILSTGSEEITICPKCKRGVEVARTGPNRKFIGCTRFPACDYRRYIPD